MKGDRGQLWAAFIDGDHVRYFTTERPYKAKLPETIEIWRANFRDKTVVFTESVDRIRNEFGGLGDAE